MRTIGRYLVTGKRAYRGHTPGTVFEAHLERNAEVRAINRGNIRLLERIVPDLEPGSYRLPRGRESGLFHGQTAGRE